MSKTRTLTLIKEQKKINAYSSWNISKWLCKIG